MGFGYQGKDLNFIVKEWKPLYSCCVLHSSAPGLICCVQLKTYSSFGIFISYLNCDSMEGNLCWKFLKMAQ